MVGIRSISSTLLACIASMACAAVLLSCSATSASPRPTPQPIPAPTSRMVSIDGHQFPVTAVEDLGVTGAAPEVDLETYRLTIDGLVGRPLVLGYNDVSKYPMISHTAILDCPGFFTDIAEWTGVPLSTLMEEARLDPRATQLSVHAIDGYQRTFPLAEMLPDGVFLALRVNGQVLPREHGYPLRLVMEGKEGNNWIKWVNRLELK